MVIYLDDFIIDEKNVSEAVSQACEMLAKGDTLCLGGRKLEFFKEGCSEKYYYISNNDSGKKQVVFNLEMKEDVTIDGEGAELLFHGEIVPFVVDKSKNIKIRNVSVDYYSPSYAQALITEAGLDKVVLQFDGEEFCCRVIDNKLDFYSKKEMKNSLYDTGLCLEFDSKRMAPSACSPTYFYYSGDVVGHGFLESLYKNVSLKQLNDNLIEIQGNLGFAHTPGNMWVCTYGRREAPGFFINESQDITLENIVLYHTQAMGVICQISENITLLNVKTEIREKSKRLLTTGADATHFVNCRGYIKIQCCEFINMMDDACNIHGMYMKINKVIDQNTLLLGYGHEQQRGINIFRPNDVLRIINTESLEVVTDCTVLSSRLTDEEELIVVLKESLPSISGECLVENISTAPEVFISETECGNNRPRGFLLCSAGKTVVENCKFYNMYSAISIGGEMLGWYESGPTKDILIINNRFSNSAYAGGTAIYFVPPLKEERYKGSFHEKVVIKNNQFTMHEKRIMNAINVQDIQFVGNKFVEDLSLPSHEQENPNGISIKYCMNSDIEYLK